MILRDASYVKGLLSKNYHFILLVFVICSLNVSKAYTASNEISFCDEIPFSNGNNL